MNSSRTPKIFRQFNLCHATDALPLSSSLLSYCTLLSAFYYVLLSLSPSWFIRAIVTNSSNVKGPYLLPLHGSYTYICLVPSQYILAHPSYYTCIQIRIASRIGTITIACPIFLRVARVCVPIEV